MHTRALCIGLTYLLTPCIPFAYPLHTHYIASGPTWKKARSSCQSTHQGFDGGARAHAKRFVPTRAAYRSTPVRACPWLIMISRARYPASAQAHAPQCTREETPPPMRMHVHAGPVATLHLPPVVLITPCIRGTLRGRCLLPRPFQTAVWVARTRACSNDRNIPRTAHTTHACRCPLYKHAARVPTCASHVSSALHARRACSGPPGGRPTRNTMKHDETR